MLRPMCPRSTAQARATADTNWVEYTGTVGGGGGWVDEMQDKTKLRTSLRLAKVLRKS